MGMAAMALTQLLILLVAMAEELEAPHLQPTAMAAMVVIPVAVAVAVVLETQLTLVLAATVVMATSVS